MLCMWLLYVETISFYRLRVLGICPSITETSGEQHEEKNLEKFVLTFLKISHYFFSWKATRHMWKVVRFDIPESTIFFTKNFYFLNWKVTKRTRSVSWCSLINRFCFWKWLITHKWILIDLLWLTQRSSEGLRRLLNHTYLSNWEIW